MIAGSTETVDERNDRFIAAANELLAEYSSFDFTVAEVVQRSSLSLRAFYRSFPGKQELVLAVFARAVADGVAEAEASTNSGVGPLDSLRSYIEVLLGAALASPTSQALIALHMHLAFTEPQALSVALEPQYRFLERVVAQAQVIGEIRRDVSAHDIAGLLLYTGVAFVHSAVARGDATSVETLWNFWLRGLGCARKRSTDGDS